MYKELNGKTEQQKEHRRQRLANRRKKAKQIYNKFLPLIEEKIQNTTIANIPAGTFATARLEHLATVNKQELIDMERKDLLLQHLLEVERDCLQFIKREHERVSVTLLANNDNKQAFKDMLIEIAMDHYVFV